ncbi:hypothetical protein B0H13DRAFT_1862592 [Mycena leptocephala]|nr:hypothetical protein B0H13DRAFT_1862592 [Mycena leptocephala]
MVKLWFEGEVNLEIKDNVRWTYEKETSMIGRRQPEINQLGFPSRIRVEDVPVYSSLMFQNKEDLGPGMERSEELTETRDGHGLGYKSVNPDPYPKNPTPNPRVYGSSTGLG